MQTHKKQDGFTLLELLVVISIMGMMGAIGFVAFGGMGRSVKFDGAAKAIKDKLLFAKNNAITKSRSHAVRMSLTPNTKEWKIQTVDSVDNIFGNDNDRIIDKEAYYLPRGIDLQEEQEVEYTPEGGISFATSNPIVITDKTDLREIWEADLTLYKGAGMVRIGDTRKIYENNGTETEDGEATDAVDPESEEDALKAITG